eukprot:gene7853-16069_t
MFSSSETLNILYEARVGSVCKCLYVLFCVNIEIRIVQAQEYLSVRTLHRESEKSSYIPVEFYSETNVVILAKVGTCALQYWRSTGVPKSVTISGRALSHAIQAWMSLGWSGITTRTLQTSAMTFDVHIEDIWGTLSGGGVVILPDPNLFPDPEHVINVIDRWEVNRWEGVPTLLKAVSDHLRATNSWDSCKSIKILMSGGEKMLDDHVNVWFDHLPQITIWNTYGPAECTVTSHYYKLERNEISGDHIPIGVPLPGYECYLLDNEGRLVPPYVTGELYIGGPGVMTGYWGQPELTSK